MFDPTIKNVRLKETYRFQAFLLSNSDMKYVLTGRGQLTYSICRLDELVAMLMHLINQARFL